MVRRKASLAKTVIIEQLMAAGVRQDPMATEWLLDKYIDQHVLRETVVQVIEPPRPRRRVKAISA